MIRVLCVDDHGLLRKGIAALINSQEDMTLLAEAANGAEAIDTYRKHQPDITLMDLRLPDMNGIDAMVQIRKEFTDAQIIVLSTYEGDAEIFRALECGARGYVSKSAPPADLLNVIRKVNSGKKHVPLEMVHKLAEHLGDESLTEREIEVLQKMASGLRNGEIAETLFISEDTVKAHVKHIMDKLGATYRTQAIAIAVRRGIIHF